MENFMRRHHIRSQIDSDIPAEYIQNAVNICTVSYIRKTLYESGLPKEAQANVIDELIGNKEKKGKT